jgi:hypothetical protein
MTGTRHLGIAVASALAAVACGASAPEVQPTSPFTEEHAEVFEDGVDLIQDPEALEGRWREEWSRDLDRRVSFSDLIALVKVSYLRTDTDPGRVTTYRIIAQVQDVLHGESGIEELELTVKQGEGGFATIDGNERQILDARFVAFIKWYTNEANEVAPHWHLAPATRPVVARVEYLIERRHQAPDDDGRTTTVIHRNEESE